MMTDEYKIWDEVGVVRAHECRPSGKIQIHAMMQYLQDAAAKHAHALGFGFYDLEEKACYWVLANIKIYFQNLPDWNMALTVRTWPSGFNRLKATREFIGIDDKGKEFLRATSEWMIIGKDTGRPLNLVDLELGLVENGERVIDEELKRLRPGQNLTSVCPVTVLYSALDLNGHVNNTEYVKWIFDALHLHGIEPNEIDSFQISYVAEVFVEDKLVLFIEDSDRKNIEILGKREGDDKITFLAKITMS